MLKNVLITASLFASLLCASEGERQAEGDSPKVSHHSFHTDGEEMSINTNAPLISSERFDELLEEFSERIPSGRKSTFWRNGSRLGMYTATLAVGVTLIGGSFYLSNTEIFTTCGYHDLSPTSSISSLQIANIALDFSRKVNMTAIINTTTNATEWFYRIPQLCTSHNIWVLPTGITGF